MKNNRTASKLISILLAFCLIISLSAVSFADTVEVPEAPGGVYVLDEAEVLDLDSENSLNSKSAKLKDDTGLEFYIVTTADKGELSLKDYTYAIFDKWNIGGDEDKGIILVLDIEDDSYYLKPGDSIREVYTGTVLQGYLDTYLEGDFANKNYGEGAIELHAAISTLGRRVLEIEESQSESNSESESESANASESEAESEAEENAGGGFWGFIGGFFKVIFVIFLILVAFVVIINVRGQMVKKKRREARLAARRQRQAERKSSSSAATAATSYPEKPVNASSFDEEDFEEIESSSNETEGAEDEVPAEFEDIGSDTTVYDDADDEFIISAFDDIIAKKQAEKGSGDFDDIDLNDIDSDEEDYEDDEE